MPSKNSVADYQALSEIEHILLRSSMYIGPVDNIESDIFISEPETSRIIKKRIQFNAGLQRIYEEIVLNAFDQTVREGTGCNEIRVSVDKETSTISVLNNGSGIPVVKKEELNCYIPEMIFGMLRSSSNYDESQERLTGGQNGLGSKLSNIFSKFFTVETVDAITKKSYLQTWTENMSAKTVPVIKACRKKPFTRVTFLPDLKRFDLSELSDDLIMLMKKRLIDIGYASSSTVKTYFNDTLISIKKVEDYTKLYDHPQGEKCIIDDTNERWSVGVVLSNDGFQHASFVNGIHTSQGGSHVDSIASQIAKEIVEKLKAKKIVVKPSDVKNRMFLFVKAAIVNPTFDSQTKETLKMSKNAFGSAYVMSDAFRKKLLASSILKCMTAVSDSKKLKDLSRSNGVKANRLTNIDNLEDATWAGTAKGCKAKLILTEGLSARTFAMSALTVIGRERYGIFPLKGKLLNVRNVQLTRVSANEEIQNIAKILGLKYDYKYETAPERATLRYGGVISLTDADSDGTHISGLIINYFHFFWPALIENGFISFCVTPIVKVYKGKQVLPFYTLNSYEVWLKTAKGAYRTKYFKGLGTSTAAEAREALTDIDDKLIALDRDGECDDHMTLAFDADRADDRKAWLMERYDPASSIDRNERSCGVSDFIDYELSHFSTYDCARSIPSIMDGLKPSQRKIMFVALKYLTKNEMKVGQLGPKVSELTDYHHGEQSLMGAIIGMAQDYVGSNNVNLLMPIGGFGTRLVGGGDAASPRYIFTKLNPASVKLFDSRDSSLLKQLESDGMKIEPEWYAPVLPMVVVNGALGIGTGFSTSVLQYNPLDVAKYIKAMLQGTKPSKTLMPWYKGFTGRIEKTTSGKYTTYAVWKFEDTKRCLHITDLPISVWTDKYKTFCEKMLTDDKSPLADVQYGNTDTIVDIKIIFKPKEYAKYKSLDEKTLVKTFKLSSSLSASNMYLFNADGRIERFANVYSIIKYYYILRLELYVKRKEALLEQLRYEIMILMNKSKFISYVKEGKINQRTMTDDSLLKVLKKDFDANSRIDGSDESSEFRAYNYLISMGYRSFTNENAKKMLDTVKDKQAEIKKLEDTTPEQMWISDINDVVEML